MTTGKLCEILKELPPTLPVLLQVRCSVTVQSTEKDSVDGELDTSFHIADIDLAKRFSQGKGWHSAVFLVADGET